MSSVKAFGTYHTSNGKICRKSAYLQFSNSSDSIGSIIMLNPGKAKLIDETIKIGVTEVSGEITLDKTMIRIVEILSQSNQNPLDGRFHIYNLFSLQNTSSKAAVKLENWIQEALISNVEVINKFRDEQHPWVLLAWSTEKSDSLKKLKEQWLSYIQESNIKVYGIKAKDPHLYYHPYPRIPNDRERYLQKIIMQLKNDDYIII
ncbi:DUF1643 domain-containing protein [Jeotgalibacillus campisalis]|uniref:DUF1643 domain-containing protein n=1 Tax=Jeotgalibacillus campisalis TaxID=220754 RepID=A0A0C2VW74_9BACL|nr:DUF1643 domain-containing protein [Jeotgalibacillus campisalis]KIL53132.1 hypothetical protein KR50_04610 [Jeotgalibacillus campisalis]